MLRALHLAAVTLLGAALLAAPVSTRWAGATALASGLALLASELIDGRLHLADLAGAVVLLKLALLAWTVADPAVAGGLFWVLLIGSVLSSHAPKPVRHWRPGRRG